MSLCLETCNQWCSGGRWILGGSYSSLKGFQHDNGQSSLACLSALCADSRSGLIRLRVAGVSSGLSCKHT